MGNPRDFKGRFSFLTTAAALPWPRPPSSLAWIIASPLNLSLLLASPPAVFSQDSHAFAHTVQQLQPCSEDKLNSSPESTRAVPNGPPLPDSTLYLVPTCPLHSMKLSSAGPQAHGTWSCPRELASVCSSPKQPQSYSLISFQSLLKCHLINDIFLDHLLKIATFLHSL